MCVRSAFPFAHLLATAVAIAFGPAMASAATPFDPWAIFSKDNIEHLCPNWIAPRTVDRHLLAKAVVEAARVAPHILRRANPDGQPVPLPVPASHYIHYVASSEPFGPNTASYSDELKAALATQRLVQASLQTWFTALPAERGKSYRLKAPTGTLVYVPDFFAEMNQVTIECAGAEGAPEAPQSPSKSSSKTGTKSDSAAAPDVFGDLTSNVIIRKGVADIGVEKNKLKKANAALFSVTGEESFRSYSIEGLVGITILGTAADRAERLAYASQSGYEAAANLPYYWFKVTPYVYHKRFDRMPDSKSSKDTNQVQPGFAGTLTFVSPTGLFAFDAIADFSQNLDAAQGSSFYNASLIVSPSFQLGHTTIFGAPLFFGSLGLRPNLSLIARQFYIDEKGLNAELARKSSFTSVGYRSELKIFALSDVVLVSNLEGRLAFTNYYNGGAVSDVSRFESGVSFTPSGADNITLELQYVRGRDERTLLGEERWTAGLGFRY